MPRATTSRSRSRSRSTAKLAIVPNPTEDATATPDAPQDTPGGPQDASRTEVPTDTDQGAATEGPPAPAQPQAGENEQPNHAVDVRLVSPAEAGPVAEGEWRRRHKAAKTKLEDLVGKCGRNHIEMDGWQIYNDSIRILFQGLIQEGRLTQAELEARLCEYQAIYLDAVWDNHVRETTQREVTEGPAAAAVSASASVGMAGRGALDRVAAARAGEVWAPKGVGRRVPVKLETDAKKG